MQDKDRVVLVKKRFIVVELLFLELMMGKGIRQQQEGEGKWRCVAVSMG